MLPMKVLSINNLDFSTKNQVIADEISIADCTRLVEVVSPKGLHSAHIRFELKGYAAQHNLPSLQLNLHADLPVICQRCLTEMPFRLDLSFKYLISETDLSEQLGEDAADELDWLEPSANMDVIALIEDEILAAMPIAPMHAQNCTQHSMQSGEKPNPFAVLKGRFK